MKRLQIGVGVAALVAVLLPVASAQTRRPYSPPRLLRAEPPPEPAPTVVGGGEVLIEFIVDVGGAVTRPNVLRSTAPYTQMVLEAIGRWRFDPARALDERGMERPVEAPLTVSALYRPPTLLNGPTVGEFPRDVARPSGDAAYAMEMVPPAYPPQALFGSVLLFEVVLNDTGQVVEARGLTASSGFESAARDALAKMRFRGATYRARPVPSVTYVVFGFRQPTTFASPSPRPIPR